VSLFATFGSPDGTVKSQVVRTPSPNENRPPRRAVGRVLASAAVGAVLIVAAYLRLWGLEHSPTGGDQAVLLNIALRWVTQGKFPLAANKSWVGLMNPPLVEYLLALPLFLRRDMVWVVRFVALVNLAGVVATYFVLREALGRRTALLATLLYAVNPWAVYYSRLVWNPTMIPLFSTWVTIAGSRPPMLRCWPRCLSQASRVWPGRRVSGPR